MPPRNVQVPSVKGRYSVPWETFSSTLAENGFPLPTTSQKALAVGANGTIWELEEPDLIVKAGETESLEYEAEILQELQGSDKIVAKYSEAFAVNFSGSVTGLVLERLGPALGIIQAPLAIHAAMRLAKTLFVGLEHVHRHYMVHRDVGLGNVCFDINSTKEEVLSGRANVKLIDFGLAARTKTFYPYVANCDWANCGSEPTKSRYIRMGQPAAPCDDAESVAWTIYSLLKGNAALPWPKMKEDKRGDNQEMHVENIIPREYPALAGLFDALDGTKWKRLNSPEGLVKEMQKRLEILCLSHFGCNAKRAADSTGPITPASARSSGSTTADATTQMRTIFGGAIRGPITPASARSSGSTTADDTTQMRTIFGGAITGPITPASARSSGSTTADDTTQMRTTFGGAITGPITPASARSSGSNQFEGATTDNEAFPQAKKRRISGKTMEEYLIKKGAEPSEFFRKMLEGAGLLDDFMNAE